MVDIRRESTWRPSSYFVVCLFFLDERKEGWGDVKRRFGAVEPVMFARVYRSHLWQGNLASFYLTSLFDACCEGLGFEKILLRF